jgi:AraC-like DNA-binding protein
MKARLILCRGCIAYFGPIVDNRPHSHHAGQIVLSIGSPFLLMQAGSTQRLEQAFIPPDTEHALDSRSMPLAVLLFESSALPGIDLEASPPLRAADHLDADCPLRALKNLLGVNEPPPPANPPLDARIARLIALARATEGPVHLADLAGRVGLSASRLTHLFTRCEGIPFKRWLLWDRLLRTVDRLAAGADLTTAAHAAGFADSAHLSRSFRAHFGIAASRIFRSRSVQVSRCPIH